MKMARGRFLEMIKTAMFRKQKGEEKLKRMKLGGV